MEPKQKLAQLRVALQPAFEYSECVLYSINSASRPIFSEPASPRKEVQELSARVYRDAGVGNYSVTSKELLLIPQYDQ